MGIKYWAQWYNFMVIPKYEVFIYIGRDKDKGIYYFRSKKQNVLITKGFNQLDAFGFRPFLLDMYLINTYTKGIQNGPPFSA